MVLRINNRTKESVDKISYFNIDLQRYRNIEKLVCKDLREKGAYLGSYIEIFLNMYLHIFIKVLCVPTCLYVPIYREMLYVPT